MSDVRASPFPRAPARRPRRALGVLVATMAAMPLPATGAGSGNARAQDASSPAGSASGPAPLPSPLVAFANANDAACVQLVPTLLARPDFAVTLKNRPVEVPRVCGCVRGVLEGDARLVTQFQGEPAAVDARLRTAEANSYLALRIVSAALACTSQEMEKSLAAAPLPR